MFVKKITETWHSSKNVQIRSFFWSVFSRIQSKYRKIRTRKNYMWTLFTQCGKKEMFEKRVISCILQDLNFAQSPHFPLLTVVQNEKKKREEIAVI